MSEQEALRKNGRKILLIGGTMRGGTTVIHRALCTAKNSNPYISESWFLQDIIALYKWNMARYEVRHADQFGSVENFKDVIKFNFQYYFNLVSVRYNDPEILILKHPELTPHFGDIHEMFPEISFLVIIRDPRDVIASIKRVRTKHLDSGVISPMTQLHSTEDFCNYYISYYTNLFRSGGNLGGKMRFVRYEDVMREPKPLIENIGKFCGAVYEGSEVEKFDAQHAQSHNFNKEKRLKDSLSGAFWSDLYTEELSTKQIGSFAGTLDQGEIVEIEQRLRPIGTRFNYWS